MRRKKGRHCRRCLRRAGAPLSAAGTAGLEEEEEVATKTTAAGMTTLGSACVAVEGEEERAPRASSRFLLCS